MKKLSLIFAFVSGSVLSFSQNNNDIIPPAPIEESKFSFGVKGAFGHSFIMPYSNYRFMPSWDAGLSAVYSPFVHWGFGLDALYSAEGMRLEDSEGTTELNLNYLRLPLKGIYFFRPYEADFRPKVAIGPTFGFLLNGSDHPAYTVFDFGGSVALGFNYRLARAIWLSVDASYYQSVTDHLIGNGVNDINGNARLNVGFSFGF